MESDAENKISAKEPCKPQKSNRYPEKGARYCGE